MKTSRTFPANFPSLFEPASASREACVSKREEPSAEGFSVCPADSVAVSAVKGGRLVAAVEFSGVADVNELLSAATAALRHLGGLVTLRLRNRTQGTTARRVVMLGRSSMPLPFRVGDAAVCTAS